MADLICNFYYLHKRQNSTKKPADGSQLASYSINLKDNTSFLNPTIEVYLPNYDTPFGWNYAFISQFAKYYYIKDYRWSTSGYWEIDLTLDVLASHVAAIKAGTYFIKYAETAFNKWIVDNRIQQIGQTRVFTTNAATTLFDFDLYKTHYIINYISQDGGSNVGGCNGVVRVTNATLQVLTMNLYQAGTTIWQDLLAQAGSAANCLVGCHSLPFVPVESSSTTIYLGNFDTGCTGHNLRDKKKSYDWRVEIPWQTNDFRRLYHTFNLYLPFIGCVPISAADCLNDDYLTIGVEIDIMSGNMTYRILHDAGEALTPFASFQGNCAARVMTSAYQNNLIGGITSLVSGAIGAGAAIENPIASGAAMMGGIVNSATSMLTKTPSCAGSYVGCAEYYDRPVLTTVYHPTAINPTSISHSLGLPYFAENTLEGFSGFIQTENAHVAGGMLADERSMIESYLNTGIYLE